MTQIFVNIPVKDLKRSIEFFTKLGFSFNQQFTDDKATCMVVSDSIFVMLLHETFFKTFTTKEIADATKTTEVIIAVSTESRQKVDEIVDKALEAGGKAANSPQDEGWMYLRSFQDPDGHMWEIMFAELTALNQPNAQSA